MYNKVSKLNTCVQWLLTLKPLKTEVVWMAEGYVGISHGQVLHMTDGHGYCCRLEEFGSLLDDENWQDGHSHKETDKNQSLRIWLNKLSNHGT